MKLRLQIANFTFTVELRFKKGDPSLTTRGLKQKLVGIWPQLRNWFVTPLGRRFFEFKFQSMEDMKKVWAMNSVNLKSGILKIFCWSKDFDPLTQTLSHAQLWIRLMHLPQEYWRQTTLFDIASGCGTPISIDKAMQSRLFGHYARILGDVDMSDMLFETVVVEHGGYAFLSALQAFGSLYSTMSPVEFYSTPS